MPNLRMVLNLTPTGKTNVRARGRGGSLSTFELKRLTPLPILNPVQYNQTSSRIGECIDFPKTRCDFPARKKDRETKEK
jgi:hypothetical protein